MRQTIEQTAIDLSKAFAAKSLAIAPIGVLQLHLDIVVRRLLRRHPKIIRRLSWPEERRALIAPTDLPVAMLVRCTPGRPRMIVMRKDDAPRADATISGPISALFHMVNGQDDGDALFFSRIVKIEGDTEVALTLRNAIDGAGIDLITDLLPAPLRAAPFAASGTRLLRRIAGRFAPNPYEKNPLQEQSW